MAITVTTKALDVSREREVTYPEGTVWDIDPYGNLDVFNENTKIGTHSSGEWSNARTVELAKAGLDHPRGDSGNAQSEPETGNAKYPGRPVADNPQA